LPIIFLFSRISLSPWLVEESFTLIERIHAEGVAILLVKQNVVQSLQVTDRAYILAEGRFVMSGTAAQMCADPELKRAYLGL
jgi:branched-chain amino acid transport system ATP-binding protein